jgi:hypothetical protein
MSATFASQSQPSEVREAGRQRDLAEVAVAVIAVTAAAAVMITLGA